MMYLVLSNSFRLARYLAGGGAGRACAATSGRGSTSGARRRFNLKRLCLGDEGESPAIRAFAVRHKRRLQVRQLRVAVTFPRPPDERTIITYIVPKLNAYFAQMRINDKNCLPADKRLCGLLGATYRWMLTQQPADLLFRRTVPLEGFFDCLTDKFHHGRIL